MCVYPFNDIDDAIKQANGLPFAFQAAVFTRSLDTALHVYRRIDAAAVMVNDHTAFRVDNMPFAGLRESGLGTGGIRHTIREMQIEKHGRRTIKWRRSAWQSMLYADRAFQSARTGSRFPRRNIWPSGMRLSIRRH